MPECPPDIINQVLGYKNSPDEEVQKVDGFCAVDYGKMMRDERGIDPATYFGNFPFISRCTLAKLRSKQQE